MKKIILLKGLPGSGKTTWAKKYIAEHANTKRVNKDELREMLDSSVWSKENEAFVLDIRDLIVSMAMIQGYNVIIDDTNFASEHEESVREDVEFHNKNTLKERYEVQTAYIVIPLEECIARNAKRAKPVPESVIREMHKKYVEGKHES